MPRGKKKSSESSVLSVARAIAGLSASERDLALEFAGVLVKKAPAKAAEAPEVNVGEVIKRATRKGKRNGRKAKEREQQTPEAKPVTLGGLAFGKGRKLAAKGAE